MHDLNYRWKQHVNSKNYYNTPLYRALKKYGIENFTIKQIGEAKNQAELNYQEWFLINEYKTLSPSGYNMQEGGGSKGKPSKQTRIKMSKSQKKRGELQKNPRCKKVIDLQSRQIWDSAMECYLANKDVVTSYGALMDWLKGRYPNKSNFRYLDMVSVVKQKRPHRGRQIIDTKTLRVYRSLVQCSRETGIPKGTLADWLKGRYPNKSNLKYL